MNKISFKKKKSTFVSYALKKCYDIKKKFTTTKTFWFSRGYLWNLVNLGLLRIKQTANEEGY